jgi:hypothetical protein
LIYCDIIEADIITNSDHSIVVTKMITGISKKPRTAVHKRLKGKNGSFNWTKQQKKTGKSTEQN